MVGLTQQTTWCKAKTCAQKPQTDSDSCFSVFCLVFLTLWWKGTFFKKAFAAIPLVNEPSATVALYADITYRPYIIHLQNILLTFSFFKSHMKITKDVFYIHLENTRCWYKSCKPPFGNILTSHQNDQKSQALFVSANL